MNRREFLKRGGAGILVALGLAGCAEVEEDDDFYEEEEDEEEVFEDDLQAPIYGAREVPGVVTTVRASK